jgi:hypothetical protein
LASWATVSMSAPCSWLDPHIIFCTDAIWSVVHVTGLGACNSQNWCLFWGASFSPEISQFCAAFARSGAQPAPRWRAVRYAPRLQQRPGLCSLDSPQLAPQLAAQRDTVAIWKFNWRSHLSYRWWSSVKLCPVMSMRTCDFMFGFGLQCICVCLSSCWLLSAFSNL